jgi:hypothetical protein
LGSDKKKLQSFRSEEVVMGTSKDVKGTKNYCDEVYAELAGMKNKIVEMRDNSRSKGGDNEIIVKYERHLSELVDEIDWKLQILSHSCPYDWEGSAEFENPVQVNEAAKSTDVEFSGGYVGG